MTAKARFITRHVLAYTGSMAAYVAIVITHWRLVGEVPEPHIFSTCCWCFIPFGGQGILFFVTSVVGEYLLVRRWRWPWPLHVLVMAVVLWASSALILYGILSLSNSLKVEWGPLLILQIYIVPSGLAYWGLLRAVDQYLAPAE